MCVFCAFVAQWIGGEEGRGVDCVSTHVDTLEWRARGWGISKAGKGEEKEERDGHVKSGGV